MSSILLRCILDSIINPGALLCGVFCGRSQCLCRGEETLQCNSCRHRVYEKGWATPQQWFWHLVKSRTCVTILELWDSTNLISPSYLVHPCLISTNIKSIHGHLYVEVGRLLNPSVSRTRILWPIWDGLLIMGCHQRRDIPAFIVVTRGVGGTAVCCCRKCNGDQEMVGWSQDR